MKFKRRLFLLSIVLCVLICLLSMVFGYALKPSMAYGVFLGINRQQMYRLQDYRFVIIEPSEFQAKQIRELHAAGKTVYGYLNIGAIEQYRPYYERFRKATLGVYGDWPNERWIDVSNPRWQAFVVKILGKQYADMGLDGFFLDNADVYYHYPTEETFQGLCAILKGLKAYGVPLLINGGDDFVTRCMNEGIASSLFDGINQETVFTTIYFKSKNYGRQRKIETLYFKAYLARAKNYGLAVYLLEYGADPALSRKIDSYCRENGFLWYNAKSLELR